MIYCHVFNHVSNAFYFYTEHYAVNVTENSMSTGTKFFNNIHKSTVILALFTILFQYNSENNLTVYQRKHFLLVGKRLELHAGYQGIGVLGIIWHRNDIFLVVVRQFVVFCLFTMKRRQVI